MTARFLAVVSSEMISVAVGWQIYALTHRPLDLGLVGLAQFAPGFLLFLVAGHTADRVARQAILKVCYIGYALCAITLLGFSIHGIASIWPIYAVLLFNGVVRAFQGPAGQAFLPQLVAVEHFANAVTWGSSFFQTATILGPIAGGLIYGIASSPVPVYACAFVGYCAALLLLWAIRLEIAARTKVAQPAGVILDGIRYIWRSKLILGCMSLDLFAMLLGGATALLPVYASEILHTGASGLGLLRAAPGLGAVAVAILLAHYPLRRRSGLSMLYCVFGFGVFTIAFGLSHSLALSLIALMLTGALDMVSVIVRSTLIQLTTPDEMRGRVSARGVHAIHRSVERSRTIRIGNYGAMVRHGSGGCIGRGRDDRDRAGLELAVSLAEESGSAGRLRPYARVPDFELQLSALSPIHFGIRPMASSRPAPLSADDPITGLLALPLRLRP